MHVYEGVSEWIHQKIRISLDVMVVVRVQVSASNNIMFCVPIYALWVILWFKVRSAKHTRKVPIKGFENDYHHHLKHQNTISDLLWISVPYQFSSILVIISTSYCVLPQLQEEGMSTWYCCKINFLHDTKSCFLLREFLFLLREEFFCTI